MKKLLLLQPPIQDFYDTDVRLQPIGLCSLKAAVNTYLPDIEVKVIDFHQGCGRRTIPLPPELHYLKKYYFLPDTSPFRTFDQFFHYGADYEAIARLTAAEKPDMVGISSLFTPYFREILACADAIRQAVNVPILVGGSHVSASPLSILKDNNIDFIIRGEGERPLIALLNALSSGESLHGVPNLGFKENSRFILNDLQDNFSLQDLPMPNFSDLGSGRYLYDGKPVCMVMTSRGCPHRCAFCSVASTFGRKFRMREPLDVAAELLCRFDQGYRVFDFEDDNLSFDLKRFKTLCRIIIDIFKNKDIQLLAMNGISYKNLDAEALRLMRQAGFTHLNLALVSADQEILHVMGRPHDVQGFPEIASVAFKYGLKTVAYQILGLPGESLGSMINTLTFLGRQPVLLGVSIFYLIPGSPLAASFPPQDEAEMVRARSTAMAIETDNVCRDALYTLFITARIFNFLKGITAPDSLTTLSELLTCPVPDSRIQKGLRILSRLFQEEKLYGIQRDGSSFPVRRFDFSLFLRALSKAEYLTMLDGRQLHLTRPT